MVGVLVMENNLTAEEMAKVLQIVKLGLLIQNAKISMNLEVKNISVYDFPREDGTPKRDYLYHFEAFFADGTYKLDQVITLLTKHISSTYYFINAKFKDDSIMFCFGLNGEFEITVPIEDIHNYIIEMGFNTVQVSEDDFKRYPANECLTKNFQSITSEYFYLVLLPLMKKEMEAKNGS